MASPTPGMPQGKKVSQAPRIALLCIHRNAIEASNRAQLPGGIQTNPSRSRPHSIHEEHIYSWTFLRPTGIHSRLVDSTTSSTRKCCFRRGMVGSSQPLVRNDGSAKTARIETGHNNLAHPILEYTRPNTSARPIQKCPATDSRRSSRRRPGSSDYCFGRRLGWHDHPSDSAGVLPITCS